MKKFLSTFFGKVVAILVILGIGFVGYGIFMPAKTVEIPGEIVEVKVPGKTIYIPGKTIEKIKEVEKIVEVEVVGDDSAELIALRTEMVDGFVDLLEKKIENFENKIEPIQDAIDNKTAEITVLQAQIDARQGLIDALITDDEIANAGQIANLRSQIIGFKAQINVLEDAIEALEENKEPWQEKIDLDTLCVAEVEAYIATGAEYSDDCEDRLEALNLI